MGNRTIHVSGSDFGAGSGSGHDEGVIVLLVDVAERRP